MGTAFLELLQGVLRAPTFPEVKYCTSHMIRMGVNRTVPMVQGTSLMYWCQ